MALAEEPGQKEKSDRRRLGDLPRHRADYPDTPVSLPQLAAAYERLGQTADADRILKQLETTRGKRRLPVC